jgi:hypothetical protein
MRLAWAMVMVVGSGAAAGAEEDVRSWTVAAEPARARLHGDGVAGSVRAFRDLGAGGVLRAQAGLTGWAPGGALDAGIEVRVCPKCRVSPVLGVGGGLMAEDEYTGTFARATAGVEAVLRPRLVLRATLQAGTHDGQAGPHLVALGLGWRF